jgi:hypothetical protein
MKRVGNLQFLGLNHFTRCSYLKHTNLDIISYRKSSEWVHNDGTGQQLHFVVWPTRVGVREKAAWNQETIKMQIIKLIEDTEGGLIPKPNDIHKIRQD